MSLFLVCLWRIETCTVFEIGKKVGERNVTLIGTLALESIPILIIGNFYAHIVCVIFWNLINTVMRNNCHDFSGKNINDSIPFNYLLNLSKILSVKFQSNYYSRQYTIVNPLFSYNPCKRSPKTFSLYSESLPCIQKFHRLIACLRW